MKTGLTLQEQFEDGYISEEEYNGIMDDINATTELLGSLYEYDSDWIKTTFKEGK